MANFQQLDLDPIIMDLNRRVRINRPTTLEFSDWDINIAPNFGQSIKIREQYQLILAETGEQAVYTNLNRFLPTTNCGYWQHLYIDSDGDSFVVREGQINAQSVPGTKFWTHTTCYEYDYKILRQSIDGFGASVSQIGGCNADLQPAAVPNTFITEENVLDYVRIIAKITSGDFSGTIDDVLDLFAETTAGYRFPKSESLFIAKNQLKVHQLDGQFRTAIGDLGLWINPAFEVTQCLYRAEIREFGTSKLSDFKIDNPIGCFYADDFNLPFPSSPTAPPQPTCSDYLNNLLATNQYFASQQAALNYQAENGILGTVTPNNLICPYDGSAYSGNYWNIA